MFDSSEFVDLLARLAALKGSSHTIHGDVGNR